MHQSRNTNRIALHANWFTRRTFVWVASLIVLGSSHLPSLHAQSWATKMFAETTHDFGSVSRNSKTEYAFVLENIYEEDVHIAAVRSSCGCTKPVVMKDTVKTWEKAEIVAQFNTRSFIGHKNAMVTVVIDKPYYAEIQLHVKGHIRSDIVTEPGEVSFGEVDNGATREIPIRISYAGRPSWKILDVRGNSDFLSVRLDEPKKANNMVSYTMHVQVNPDAPDGELHDELTVVTNDAQENSFSLPVTARIIPPVSISPPQILLGRLTSTDKSQQRFVIKSKKPFKITAIECEDSRFQFKIPSDERPVHVIPFEFTGSETTGDFRQKVIVQTSLGEKFAAECVVIGQVIK